jgi:hypothetical protein
VGCYAETIEGGRSVLAIFTTNNMWKTAPTGTHAVQYI